MMDVTAATATFERNIASQTGRTVSEWADLARAGGAAKHGEIVALLKSAHGLSHAHANHIAKHATNAASPQSDDDPVLHLFAGKEALRPLYDRPASAAQALGPDVELAPKKANVSVRRRRQFALIQPGTRTRIDLGLILPDVPPTARLEPSGSFNAMFTHRVKLAPDDAIDDDVLAWLQRAYDAAG